ncbi:MAG: hypothetical protein R3C11_08910 [Planctomycetaceae bacterium]
MSTRYQISDSSTIISPRLVIFEEIVDENIQKMINIAGSADRLRPHCKTHKMSEVARKLLAAGIINIKRPHSPGAQNTGGCGSHDIFLAYNLVGPNIQRAVKFVKTYPKVTFSVTADHEHPLSAIKRSLFQSRSDD